MCLQCLVCCTYVVLSLYNYMYILYIIMSCTICMHVICSDKLLALAIVTFLYIVSNDDYQQILQKHWMQCNLNYKEELNCATIKDAFWADGFIDKSDLEIINNLCTIEYSNGVVLHRLLLSNIAPVLLKFAHLLQIYMPTCHTHYTYAHTHMQTYAITCFVNSWWNIE